MNPEEEVVDPNYNPEEEVLGCDYKIVDLPEVKIENNEAEEEVVFSAKSKIYRWTDSQWKERGIGELKIIRNKKSSIYRCFLRQEQTMKLRCMFEIVGQHKWLPEKLKTAEKSWLWSCYDYSEGKAKFEKFCARFKTEQEYEKFEQMFKKGYEENAKLVESKIATKKEVTTTKTEVHSNVSETKEEHHQKEDQKETHQKDDHPKDEHHKEEHQKEEHKDAPAKTA